MDTVTWLPARVAGRSSDEQTKDDETKTRESAFLVLSENAPTTGSTKAPAKGIPTRRINKCSLEIMELVVTDRSGALITYMLAV
ncbi:MAG TPA: hypothetical protein PLZ86_05350 [bacterium]|nr:hypothetical protein [bacterium]